jgi:hypothetical protein
LSILISEDQLKNANKIAEHMSQNIAMVLLAPITILLMLLSSYASQISKFIPDNFYFDEYWCITIIVVFTAGFSIITIPMISQIASNEDIVWLNMVIPITSSIIVAISWVILIPIIGLIAIPIGGLIGIISIFMKLFLALKIINETSHAKTIIISLFWVITFLISLVITEILQVYGIIFIIVLTPVAIISIIKGLKNMRKIMTQRIMIQD